MSRPFDKPLTVEESAVLWDIRRLMSGSPIEWIHSSRVYIPELLQGLHWCGFVESCYQKGKDDYYRLTGKGQEEFRSWIPNYNPSKEIPYPIWSHVL